MNEPQSNRKQLYVSLQAKLLVGFTLLFTVVFALAFYWFYHFTTQMSMNRVSDDLEVLLLGTAAKVNGDEFQALVQEAKPRADGYTDDPRYWDHVKWLATVADIDTRARFYSYVKGTKPNEVIFVGSNGALWNPPAGAKFLESFVPEYKPEIIFNGLITTTFLLEIYPDPWGSWISGYTPIKNSKGEVVGGLGADYEASYVLQVQKSIRNSVAVAFAFTYFTLFILVFYISISLTRPIKSLTKLTEKIGEGEYDQDFSGLMRGMIKDEISKLAHDFAIMVGKVYLREQALRRQVQELKIEIDESKRQHEVSEIVETDFFKDLQARANNMRVRRMTKSGIFSRDILKEYMKGDSTGETPPSPPNKD